MSLFGAEMGISLVPGNKRLHMSAHPSAFTPGHTSDNTQGAHRDAKLFSDREIEPTISTSYLVSELHSKAEKFRVFDLMVSVGGGGGAALPYNVSRVRANEKKTEKNKLCLT